MNKKERIYNAVAGKPTDQLPYAFWTHLPGIDLDPDLLAEETYKFFKKYDTDLIKTMNNGFYATEDFGCQIDYSAIKTGGTGKVVATPVNSLEDWKKITEKDFDKCEAIQRELYSLKRTLELVKDENVPIIFTVFSPFTTANKLSGNRLLEHISSGKTAVIHRALQIITDLTVKTVRKANELGADGIFFASQMSSYDVTTEEIFKEFGKQYDVQVLQASEGYCDTIHCHGTNIMTDILKDYPVDIFNWHAWESEPTLQQAKTFDKCLMGGLDRRDITSSNFEAIRYQIEQCWEVFKGYKHILAPGCVIRYPLNTKALSFIKETALEVTGKK